MRTVFWAHKVHIYLEYHSVCPLDEIGIPPTPSPTSGCTSPSGTGGEGGHTHLRVRGVGGGQGWAKLVLIALERYSVALKRLTFNLR